MAEFLTTTGVSDRLEKIIREANQRLVLISPYLKLNPRFKDLLKQKADSKTHVRIIYGKRDPSQEEQEWLDSVPAIELCFRQNLHAKCYLNEKEAILTSMNLYQFSEQNNEEMGILVSRVKVNDRELYRAISKEADQIAELSVKVREVPKSDQGFGLAGRLKDIFTRGSSIGNLSDNEETQGGDAESIAGVEPSDNGNDRLAEPQTISQAPSRSTPTAGFCIRCKADLVADPSKPYCLQCYRAWNRSKNPDYEEKHCHLCGKEHGATLAKPVCLDCYRAYRDQFEFAAV